jgi:hypothetical protein
MLVLPIDGSRTLLVLGLPAPQFKDKANGVAATDRVTGAPLAEVPLALTVEGGQPQVSATDCPSLSARTRPN